MDIKNKIRKAYDELDGYPTFANCQITYKDDKTVLDVAICMYDGQEDEELDDHIFFYVTSVEDLISLCDDGTGEDFMVTDFYEFSDTI